MIGDITANGIVWRIVSNSTVTPFAIVEIDDERGTFVLEADDGKETIARRSELFATELEAVEALLAQTVADVAGYEREFALRIQQLQTAHEHVCNIHRRRLALLSKAARLNPDHEA
jgi:hypothetical protein